MIDGRRPVSSFFFQNLETFLECGDDAALPFGLFLGFRRLVVVASHRKKKPKGQSGVTSPHSKKGQSRVWAVSALAYRS